MNKHNNNIGVMELDCDKIMGKSERKGEREKE